MTAVITAFCGLMLSERHWANVKGTLELAQPGKQAADSQSKAVIKFQKRFGICGNVASGPQASAFCQLAYAQNTRQVPP